MKKLLLIVLIVLLSASTVFADTHYISTSGTDSSDCIGSPCKTFSYVQGQATSGDTIELVAGTYNSDEGALLVTKSGLTFQCETDTMTAASPCIIDGEDARTPFELLNKDNVTVIGIYFKNGDPYVIDADTADNLTMQRVTGADIDHTLAGNYHVWLLDDLTNSLIEDCAAWGWGRNTLLFFGSASTTNTIRRFAAIAENERGDGGLSCVQIYESRNNTIENILCTHQGTYLGDDDTDGTADDTAFGGISIWDNNSTTSASDNSVLGSVVWDLNSENDLTGNGWGIGSSVSDSGSATTGNEYKNVVVINTGKGGVQWGQGATVNYHNITVVDSEQSGMNKRDAYSNGLTTVADLKDSIIMNSGTCGYQEINTGAETFNHTYNTFYSNPIDHFCDDAQDSTENNTQPTFDTTTYGDGAYLIAPSNLSTSGSGGGQIGAEVLYKYEDGVLGTDPLWPWPMEGRIFAESGVSPTYSETQGSGESGGLWKTLDGVYSAPAPWGGVSISRLTPTTKSLP